MFGFQNWKHCAAALGPVIALVSGPAAYAAAVGGPAALPPAPGAVHLAQVIGVPVGVPSNDEEDGEVGADGDIPASDTVTNKVTLLITQISLVCAGLPDVYLIDCLAKEYRNAANSLPGGSDYNEAKKALNQAASDLRSLVRSNVDTAQPRVRVQIAGGSGRATTRPLSAMKPEAVKPAKEAALEIISATETILLRSAEGSQSRQDHYAQIAEAIGSNKVLLRS